MPTLGNGAGNVPVPPKAVTTPLRLQVGLDDAVVRDFSRATLYADNAASPITTPTYDGSGQIAEIDVIYQPQGWNGWKYWMANGPYPGSDSSFENASLLVSNDGVTWQVPAGGTNPLIPHGAGFFNSDPSIFLDGDGTMYVCWVVQYNGTGDFHVPYIKSTDGINWTAPVDLFSLASQGDSPIIVWDGTNYWCYYHYSGTLYYSKATSLTGLSAPALPTNITGYSHTNIQLWQGRFYMLINDAGTNNLYFATSIDGIAWTVQATPVLTPGVSGAWDAGQIYRTAFVLNQGPTGPEVEMFYCAKNGAGNVWHVGHVFGKFGNVRPDRSTKTLAGTTAGTAASAQPFTGTSYKKFVVFLNGYENTTVTAQTITFPVAFTNTPFLAKDDSAGATVSTTTLTLPASMGTTKTGWIVVEGF